jgi:hypothetical protein
LGMYLHLLIGTESLSVVIEDVPGTQAHVTLHGTTAAPGAKQHMSCKKDSMQQSWSQLSRCIHDSCLAARTNGMQVQVRVSLPATPLTANALHMPLHTSDSFSSLTGMAGPHIGLSHSCTINHLQLCFARCPTAAHLGNNAHQ